MNMSAFSHLSKTTFLFGTIMGFLLLGWNTNALAKERHVSLKWNELDAAVGGKRVAVAFPDGEIVEGKVLSLGSDSLVLDAIKTTNKQKYPKGRISIPRPSVSVLRLSEIRGHWRILGTAIGAGTGTLFGIALYTYANNEAAAEQGALAATVLIGGGAGLGYLGSRSADRHVLVITVVP
jgi:hypothetical protein